MSLRYEISRRIQNAAYKLAPWTVVLYARKAYGYPLRELIAVWKASEADEKDTFLGMEHTREIDFFTRLVDRQHEESEIYQCIEGCCTVIWHPKKGNTGGMGPAGCPCDEMEDPRDMQRGVIRKGL